MKKLILIIIFTSILFSNYSYSQSGWIKKEFENVHLRGVFFLNLNTGYIAGGNILYKTTNGGINWTSIITGNGYISAFRVFDESNIVLMGNEGYYGFIRYSHNGGSSWTNSYFYANLEIMNSEGMDWQDINTGYSVWVDFGFSNYYGRIFKTTNGGSNWFEQYPPSTSPFLEVKYKNLDTAFILASAWLMKTTNQGNNWTVHGTIGGYPEAFFFPNFDTIYTGGTEIKRSTDKGINWTTLHIVPLYKSIRKMYFINTQTGWAVGGGSSIYNWNGYIVRTTNLGTHWQVQDSNNYSCLRDVFFLDENTGWIVGDSGIVLKTTTGGTTFINTINNEIPNRFRLYQNYPNPFNPITNIQFDLPRDVYVTLKVYDVLGKEIEILINDFYRAGSYLVSFDGSKLSSGVYFYTIQAGSFKSTKRMLFIK